MGEDREQGLNATISRFFPPLLLLRLRLHRKLTKLGDNWAVTQAFLIRDWVLATLDRPFPSSLVALFQNESKCETFLMKMSLICMKMKL